MKDWYCFHCSLQFDKKSIHKMHEKIVHGRETEAISTIENEVKCEPKKEEITRYPNSY